MHNVNKCLQLKKFYTFSLRLKNILLLLRIETIYLKNKYLWNKLKDIFPR